MIVILGRPGLARGPGPDGRPALDGLVTRVALLVSRAGAGVEVVGALGDDPEGDLVAVELGRAGVGHAALLRDPAGRTPLFDATGQRLERGPLPRLEAGDVELGLRYLVDCRVLVIADVLASDAAAAASEGARYHGAAVIAVVPAGETVDASLAARSTVLEAPAQEPHEEGDENGREGDAFASLVATFALRLDRGEETRAAFDAALRSSPWETAPGG